MDWSCFRMFNKVEEKKTSPLKVILIVIGAIVAVGAAAVCTVGAAFLWHDGCVGYCAACDRMAHRAAGRPYGRGSCCGCMSADVCAGKVFQHTVGVVCAQRIAVRQCGGRIARAFCLRRKAKPNRAAYRAYCGLCSCTRHMAAACSGKMEDRRNIAGADRHGAAAAADQGSSIKTRRKGE